MSVAVVGEVASDVCFRFKEAFVKAGVLLVDAGVEAEAVAFDVLELAA